MLGTEKSRLERLTAISTQLQSKRLITATELASRHGVSIRTIYRDIQALQNAGLPILTEEGKGYKLMEGYKLPPLAFTPDETIALIIAEKLIEQNGDASLIAHFKSATTKIRAVLKLSE